MAQLTDLNVSPYYDDFSKDKDFHRVLFRPGFAVQARELTTLQSILQNQIEQHGNHMFKEGTVVIPGQLSTMDRFQTLRLAGTFANETINPSSFYNETNAVTITGQTSGVTAKVVGFQAATTTEQPLLFVQYVNTGTDGSTERFSNGENITANAAITHTTTYAANNASATTFTPIDSTQAAQDGYAVQLEEGVYYVRGQFVRCAKQRLVLSTNSRSVTARVGFTITETLTTPETDTSLTDNATGSSNFAAKGAHRLKITLTLSQKSTTATDDSDFVELMRIENGTEVGKARVTEYDVLGDTLARRTFDESGSYTVRPFTFDLRESIDQTSRQQNYQGVFQGKTTTDDGNTPSVTSGNADFVISGSEGIVTSNPSSNIINISTNFAQVHQQGSASLLSSDRFVIMDGGVGTKTNTVRIEDVDNDHLTGLNIVDEVEFNFGATFQGEHIGSSKVDDSATGTQKADFNVTASNGMLITTVDF